MPASAVLTSEEEAPHSHGPRVKPSNDGALFAKHESKLAAIDITTPLEDHERMPEVKPYVVSPVGIRSGSLNAACARRLSDVMFPFAECRCPRVVFGRFRLFWVFAGRIGGARSRELSQQRVRSPLRTLCEAF